MKAFFVLLALLVFSAGASADMYPDASNAKLPDARANLAAVPHVPTNAALMAAATTAFPSGVWRDTFGNGNNAPPLFYLPSTAPCPFNSGDGDNGSQVKSADSKCWLAAFPAVGADVREWGPQCATDAGPQINAAVAAYGVIVFPVGTCKVTTPVVLTRFPIRMSGLGSWPSTAGLPTTILCATGTSDCFSTALTTTQKSSIQLNDLVFDGTAMTGGNVLHLSNTTKSNYSRLTLNNVWNGIEVDGPNDNINVFDNLLIQGCRGDQGVLWTNPSMANNSNVLTFTDSTVTCNSAANGIVIDGNVQTLRLSRVAVIDSGTEVWMRNTGASTTCPGYVFADDIEFNGGPHTANFFKADCGYSVQMVNAWSYGTTTGDGFVFNYAVGMGSNQVQISNSQLLGDRIGGRCLFIDWNNVYIANTVINGCVGSVLAPGPHVGPVTSMIGGNISGSSAGYCVETAAGPPANSLRIIGTNIDVGTCASGGYNDAGLVLSLDSVLAMPPLKSINNITGCGSGCTVTPFSGNQFSGTLLMTAGAGTTAVGTFDMNFTVALRPSTVCVFGPRQGGSGSWPGPANVKTQDANSLMARPVWNTNDASVLTASQDYFIDYRCGAQ